MKSTFLYKYLFKGEKYRIVEFLSILSAGLVGNIIVSKVNLYFVFTINFFRYIDWIIIIQIILLLLITIRMFSFSGWLKNFQLSVNEAYKKDKKNNKKFEEYFIDKIPEEQKKIHKNIKIILVYLISLIIISYAS